MSRELDAQITAWLYAHSAFLSASSPTVLEVAEKISASVGKHVSPSAVRALAKLHAFSWVPRRGPYSRKGDGKRASSKAVSACLAKAIVLISDELEISIDANVRRISMGHGMLLPADTKPDGTLDLDRALDNDRTPHGQ